MEIGSNNLSEEDIQRFSRQIYLPEINKSGQLKIKESKILIVGAGGLGSPCIMYLSGSGVGTLGIVDGDIVEKSNLHRQVIHSKEGLNKAVSAALFVKNLNPNVKVNVYESRFDNNNCLDIAKNYDIIIDCSDNPMTRYIISDTAVFYNIPLVSGSAIRWEGQLTIYVSNNKTRLPCYRCLFPKCSPSNLVGSCSEEGVLGTVPGFIGVLQANEALKLILGYGEESLSQRMLIYDGFNMSIKIFKSRPRQKDCLVCSDENKLNEDFFKKYDYLTFVGGISCKKRLDIPDKYNVKWKEVLDDKDEYIVLDCRKNNEIETKNISTCEIDELYNDLFKSSNLYKNNFSNFIKLPFEEIKNNDFDDKIEINEKLEIVKKSKKVYIYCNTGNLSTHAVDYFIKNGCDNCMNILEGIKGICK